ncbi:uncharacterized protein VTP21DRAFT_8651 [Calcarisporiella thermophila]|uniref:uncharacterized protein n=1 Tax=Calcarisporiella thermophila TaxID=911321 RepID=UPI0037449E4D
MPSLSDSNIPLPDAELEVLRKQFHREGENVTLTTKFNLAWGLIKSRRSNDQREGMELMRDIYDNDPQRRRECIYYLAVGHYKLGEYSEARHFVDALLRDEPRNPQATELKKAIDDRVSRDGIIGLAIVGGLIAVVGGAIAALRNRDRSRS